jgi:hypothetical protein
MIARCDTCARSYLEIDSRKLEHPLLCCSCAIDSIAQGEALRIAAAAQALRAIATIPAQWIAGNRKRAR